jgi:hypothetical protein
MAGFIIRTQGDVVIRFRYYEREAPFTSVAFASTLPFTRTFYHARVSGEEIWIDDAPKMDVIQENASVFTEVGEVVFGPMKPERTKTAGCLGIYYGAGKGLDCANIFAKVEAADLALLRALGEEIWRHGAQELRFEAIA